jgi:2-(3-amino-3-carboxypropyl)histidine synthase
MGQTEMLIEKVGESGAKRIMLQLPSGLKTKTFEIAKKLEKQGIDVIVSNSPCYGACDIADEEAKQAHCDALVHVGHSKFYRDFETAVPVIYFPWLIDVTLNDSDFSEIKEKRIGLLTTVQHLNVLPQLKEMLEERGKHVEIGGQVLGCWFANADKISEKVDAFLYVGSGKFHPSGYVDKKIYAMDVETGKISQIDRVEIEKRRWANIHNAKDAKTFAVLVTTKKGQHELLGKAEKIRNTLEKWGRSAFIMIMREIHDDSLAGIRADAFVNTACPRIVEDHFSKPFINAEDLEEVFN